MLLTNAYQIILFYLSLQFLPQLQTNSMYSSHQFLNYCYYIPFPYQFCPQLTEFRYQHQEPVVRQHIHPPQFFEAENLNRNMTFSVGNNEAPRLQGGQDENLPFENRNNHEKLPTHNLELTKKLNRKKRNELQRIVETQWDRNVTSNLFKIYLKNMRRDLSIPSGHHSKIILKVSDSYTIEGFQAHLDEYLDPKLNYIRPNLIKSFCRNENRAFDPRFSKVFRISIKHFLKTTIYLLNTIKSKRRNSIKKQHLIVRSKILAFLFDDEKLNQITHIFRYE